MRYSNWIMLIMIMAAYPVGKLLPPVWAWENGPIEWSQVVILGFGMALCWVWAVQAYRNWDAVLARFWAWTTPAWLILIGRELSWGRVFYPVRISETGPILAPLNQLPYGTAVYPAIAILALVWLFAIIRYKLYRIPFELAAAKRFPVTELAVTFLACVVSYIGEKYLHFTMLEEIVEALAYLGLVLTAVHVRLNLAGRKKEYRLPPVGF